MDIKKVQVFEAKDGTLHRTEIQARLKNKTKEFCEWYDKEAAAVLWIPPTDKDRMSSYDIFWWFCQNIEFLKELIDSIYDSHKEYVTTQQLQKCGGRSLNAD